MLCCAYFLCGDPVDPRCDIASLVDFRDAPRPREFLQLRDLDALQLDAVAFTKGVLLRLFWNV